MKECSKFVDSSSNQELVPTEIESQHSVGTSFPSLLMISTDEPLERKSESDTDSSYEEEMKAMSKRMPQMLTELNSHFSEINEKSKMKFNKQKASKSKPKSKGNAHNSNHTQSLKSPGFNSAAKSSAFEKRKRTIGLKNKYHQKLPPKPGTSAASKNPPSAPSKSPLSGGQDQESSLVSEDETDDHNDESSTAEEIDSEHSSELSDTEMLLLKNLTLKNVNSVYGETYYEDVSVRKKTNKSTPADASDGESDETCIRTRNESTSMYTNVIPSSGSSKYKLCKELTSGKRHLHNRKQKTVDASLDPSNDKIDLSMNATTSNARVKKNPKKNKKASEGRESKLIDKSASVASVGKKDTLIPRERIGNDNHLFTKNMMDSKARKSKDELVPKMITRPDVLNVEKHNAEPKAGGNKKGKNQPANSIRNEANEINCESKRGKHSTYGERATKEVKKSEFIPKAILKRPKSAEKMQCHLSIKKNLSTASNSVQKHDEITPKEDIDNDDDDEMDMSKFLDKMLEETIIATPVVANASAVTHRALPCDEDLDKLFEDSLSKPSFATRKRLLNRKLT